METTGGTRSVRSAITSTSIPRPRRRRPHLPARRSAASRTNSIPGWRRPVGTAVRRCSRPTSRPPGRRCVPVAPGVLRRIHGQIGTRQQFQTGICLIREAGDADRGRQQRRGVVDDDRFARRPLSRRSAVRAVRSLDTGRSAALRTRPRRAVRRGPRVGSDHRCRATTTQHFVADGMTHLIIHTLEAIDVDPEEGASGSRAMSCRQFALERSGEGRSTRNRSTDRSAPVDSWPGRCGQESVRGAANSAVRATIANTRSVPGNAPPCAVDRWLTTASAVRADSEPEASAASSTRPRQRMPRTASLPQPLSA